MAKPDTSATQRSFMWTATHGAHVLRAQQPSAAVSINDKGDIASSTALLNPQRRVGTEAMMQEYHGRLLKVGDLQDPNSQYVFSYAVQINNHELMAVNSAVPFQAYDEACVWSKQRGLVSLGLGSSSATAISNKGVMLGTVNAVPLLGLGEYSFVWTQADGVNKLSDLLARDSLNITSIRAQAMSGAGNIAGSAVYQDVSYAVLLTPQHD